MADHSSLPTTDPDGIQMTTTPPPSSTTTATANSAPAGVPLSKASKSKSTSMRFQGSGLKEATLVWSKVCKFVTDAANDGAKKQILTSVSGAAKPGEMIALMGPSGSGKTTLLNILGGRGLSDVSGDVYINNVKFKKSMRKTIAYVLQEDLFFTQLTVREQLTITSHLRLPSSLSNDAKTDAVDNVIQTLRIEKCSNTQIMLISGGEKKRCNIGTELLTNPSIMLLDEPTSGLDSNGATALVGTLREMANDNMTLISSIHQPSSKVFYTFDKLILLADGHIVYSGPPAQCLVYLAKLNYIPPGDYNPADFVMDLVAIVTSDDDDGDDDDEEEKDKMKENAPAVASAIPLSARMVLIAAWDNDITDNEALQTMREYESRSGGGEVSATGAAAAVGDDIESLKYMASYQVQFITLLRRALIIAKSNIVTNLQFINTIGMGLISGFCWFSMEYTENRIQDRAGFIFFFMTFWFFMTLFQGMMQFLPERTIMLKDRAAGSYRLSAYFLSKTMSDTPVRLLMPLIYVIISYPMTTLNPDATVFFAVLGTQLLAALAGESVGLFIGTSTMDYEKAMVIATLVSLALMLTGGYFVQNLPSFVQWIRYLSPFKYSYDACLRLVFDRSTPCDNGEIIVQCLDGRDSVSGTVVVDYLGGTESVGLNVGMLCVFIIFFRIAAYLALKYIPHNNGGRT